MRVRGIRACDENAFGFIDVFVARGRRIGAERCLVTRHGGRHAQPRIGIDVVGADQAFREFVEDVIVFGEQLAGNIERDTVGAMLADNRGELFRGDVQCVIPVHARTNGRARAAQLRIQRARVVPGGQMQRRTLGAEPAEIRRMRRIAAHAGDTAARSLDQDAAADSAVTARRWNGLHGFPIATHVPAV